MDSDIRSCLGNRRLTLEHLRTFVIVAEDVGFSSAAIKLHRSQSAITQNLRKLEQIVGCTLLDRRQGRVIGLTDEGKRFLPRVYEILNLVAVAIRTVQEPSTQSLIRLGVPDNICVGKMNFALADYLARHPQLKIEIHAALSEKILELMRAKELDVALFKRITGSLHVERDFKQLIVLKTETLHWVGRDDTVLDKRRVLELALFPDGCPYRKAALEVLEERKIKFNISYTGSSYDNIKRAVLAGMGVGVLPAGSISAQEMILSEADGFPPLPTVELVAVINSEGRIYEDIGEYIVKSYVVK